ncbi:MAG: aldolase/citrate lyase family protein [Saprospiraceae bacterium]|jgi:2-keto-3-deoxy-L-rhamnonate aldolase RhmA|nr:aldolase/citrate lyase family protein [Saprospiraceae bacterium]
MDLFLFSNQLSLSLLAEQSGVDHIIIDWERDGKKNRQKSTSFELNHDTLDDLIQVAEHTALSVTVRINPLGSKSEDELNKALDHGASVIMLPMSKSALDVEQFLRLVNGRAQTLIQIETKELIEDLKAFSELPWDYTHVGLNDLMISKQYSTIWEAVVDGTIENICTNLEGKKYGFGGMTIVTGGHPIPFALLLHEMVRLQCSMGILRRSFKQDVADKNMQQQIHTIRDFISKSKLRSLHLKNEDSSELHHKIREVIQTTH